MSEDSQVTITTQDDIDRLQSLIIGNSTRNTRMVMRKLERRIIMYKSRLSELYRNESIVKARIYNNADRIKIETEYAAGKNKKNIDEQSFKEMNVAQDPNHSVAYDKFNLMSLEEGVRKFDAELNRINTEIKDLEAAVKKYQEKYDELKAMVEKGDEDEQDSRKIERQRRLFPTEEDLIADQIAQAKVANVLLLLEISRKFSELSQKIPGNLPTEGTTYAEWLDEQENNKAVGFPDGDRRTVNQLRVYTQLFWAHGHSIGDVDLVDESGEVETVALASILVFDNPANQKNITTLEHLVTSQRGASKNDRLSKNVQQYVRDIDSVIADPTISKGVEISPDKSIPVSESMRADTINYPNAALKFGDFYLGSFELPNLKDCITKNWKRRQAKLYTDLPVCPNAKPSGTDITSSDEKITDYEAQKDEKTQEAEAKYLARLRQAQVFVEESVKIDLGDLPEDAVDWVKTYVGKHKQAAHGIYVYQGNQVVGTRGTADATNSPSEARAVIELALTRARGMITFRPQDNMEEKAAHYYYSITGYTFHLKSGDMYVPLNFYKTIFEDNQIPAKYGRKLTNQIKAAPKTDSGEIVAYILYGKKDVNFAVPRYSSSGEKAPE